MKTQTMYFGEVEYSENELIHFPVGIYGFEDEHDFLLLPFEEDGMLFSLQSVTTPSLSFTLMHPFSLTMDYAPVLQKDELEKLSVEKSEDLYYYVTCAVKNPVSESTVNMRCPVAINPDTRIAMQVILNDIQWDMRQKLSDFSAGKDGDVC